MRSGPSCIRSKTKWPNLSIFIPIDLQATRAPDHLRPDGAARVRVPDLPERRGQVRLPAVGGGRQPGPGRQLDGLRVPASVAEAVGRSAERQGN